MSKFNSRTKRANATRVDLDEGTRAWLCGAKSIPISQLKIGSFHTVEGKRLQVNASVTRYQRELAYLMSII
jgi:hypothetical protein